MRRYESWMNRILGKRLPVTLQMFVDLFEEAKCWLEELNRRSQEKHLASAQQEVLELRAEGRGRAADQAAAEGYAFFKVKVLMGPVGFNQWLDSIDVCRRTVLNLMSVAYLAKKYPDIYRRLRVLGPTKLYRVAGLPKDKLEKLDPTADVVLTRGKVKLKELTDKELIIYLRELCPPEQRAVWKQGLSKARTFYNFIENAVRRERPLPADAQMIDNFIRNASLLLTG